MVYNQEITLDLNSNTAPIIVGAKQGDENSRTFLVHYIANGEEYHVYGPTVALRIRKPDGHVIFNDATINYDGTVTVTLSYQSLTSAGRAYADLIEFGSNGQTLSTVSFIIDIQASPDIHANQALSSDEFLYLKSFIDRGNEIIGEAESWANGYNGDTPVSSDNPAYHNNAKYYMEALRSASVRTVTTADPGKPAEVSAGYDSSANKFNFDFKVPLIKPHATAMASMIDPSTGQKTGAVANVSVNVRSVPDQAGTGELGSLQSSFDFAFEIPQGSSAGFASSMDIDFRVLASNETAYGSVIPIVSSPNSAKQFKFSFGIPAGASGSQGLPGRDGISVTGSAGPAGVGIESIYMSDDHLHVFLNNGQHMMSGSLKGAPGVSGSGTNFSIGEVSAGSNPAVTGSIIDDTFLFNFVLPQTSFSYGGTNGNLIISSI